MVGLHSTYVRPSHLLVKGSFAPDGRPDQNVARSSAIELARRIHSRLSVSERQTPLLSFTFTQRYFDGPPSYGRTTWNRPGNAVRAVVCYPASNSSNSGLPLIMEWAWDASGECSATPQLTQSGQQAIPGAWSVTLASVGQLDSPLDLESAHRKSCGIELLNALYFRQSEFLDGPLQHRGDGADFDFVSAQLVSKPASPAVVTFKLQSASEAVALEYVFSPAAASFHQNPDPFTGDLISARCWRWPLTQEKPVSPVVSYHFDEWKSFGPVRWPMRMSRFSQGKSFGDSPSVHMLSSLVFHSVAFNDEINPRDFKFDPPYGSRVKDLALGTRHYAKCPVPTEPPESPGPPPGSK